MRSEAIQAFRQDGVALRVEFEKQKDRYGHTISIVDPSGAITPLLESVEGAPNDNWPPSPPLQTLSIEKLPDGRTAALLVGMAGRSHWSASIEAAINRPELIFDIACRRSDSPPLLGSVYRRLELAHSMLSVSSSDASVTNTSDAMKIVPRSHDGKTTRWRYQIALKAPTAEH